MGQRRRIAEFLTSTESRGLRIADWLNRNWLVWVGLNSVFLAFIIFPIVLHSNRLTAAIVAAASLALYSYEQRVIFRRGFTLTVRPRERSVIQRLITTDNALLLLVGVLGIFATLADTILRLVHH